MSFMNLFFIAIGLSMDAFAVAICKGLALKKITFRHAAVVGLWFGAFQAVMPLLGYLLGSRFQHYIAAIDHWIAFILLGLIGCSMIREALSNKEESAEDASLGFKTMFIMALATSIDALAVGITFAFLQVSILPAVILIGTTTVLLSMVGVKAGSAFGTRYKTKAQLAGGFILILMGAKILIEHLFF